jgi:hypothetical protein
VRNVQLIETEDRFNHASKDMGLDLRPASNEEEDEAHHGQGRRLTTFVPMPKSRAASGQ